MSLLDPTPTSIRQAIWEGTIPCAIHLNPSESRVFDNSDPFYVGLNPSSISAALSNMF